MNAAAIDVSILGPAFIAGLLVLATHVPLGREVLARGIIFIDLAVAQIAGLGVIAANSFGLEPGGLQVQVVAMGSALAGAALFAFAERHWPDVQEALIGCTFALAATGAILLLSTDPHGGENLKDLLVGQILWVSYEQLAQVAALYAVVLALWLGAGERLGQFRFYVSFAIAVTASVQLVGVYLVFASLIIPALAMRHASGHPLVKGFAVGIAGYALGLIVSAVYDLPAGAAIVWALAVLGGGFALARHRFRLQR